MKFEMVFSAYGMAVVGAVGMDNGLQGGQVEGNNVGQEEIVCHGNQDGNLAYFQNDVHDEIFRCNVITGTLHFVWSEQGAVISLPNLKRVEGGIHVQANPRLACTSGVGFFASEISLENLESVGQAISISGTPSLEVLNCPKLRTVQRLDLYELPKLKTVHMPNLVSIANPVPGGQNLYSMCLVRNNPVLKTFELPNLQEVGNHVLIHENETLTTVIFPNLRIPFLTREEVWAAMRIDVTRDRKIGWSITTKEWKNWFNPDASSLGSVVGAKPYDQTGQTRNKRQFRNLPDEATTIIFKYF